MELRLLEAVPWPLDFAISLKGDEGMELKREKFDVTQCENFMIFLPLRFYVKSILGIVFKMIFYDFFEREKFDVNVAD